MEDNDMFLPLLIVWLIVGGIAGWLAGIIVSGRGFGLLGDIVIGIIGSVVAGMLFGTVFPVVAPGMLGAIIVSTIGAVIVLVAAKVIRRIA
jgi:uncharacterized membrane protein YeaQ/YmgE (transglycosylase-associated protein family)